METVKINRREFLKAAGAGALALGLAPGLLSAAGRNVAPAPAGNPLFTGELGVYQGVTIFEKDQITELVKCGSTTVRIRQGKSHFEWIPIQTMRADLDYYSGDQWTRQQTKAALRRRG